MSDVGPTHQVVEQRPSLRMISNMNVWHACLIFSSSACLTLIVIRLIFLKGGCLVRATDGTPDVIATEVQVAPRGYRAIYQGCRVFQCRPLLNLIS